MPALLSPLKWRNRQRWRAEKLLHRSFGQKKATKDAFSACTEKKQTFVAQVVYVRMVRLKNRLKRASAHCFEPYLISIYKEACQ